MSTTASSFRGLIGAALAGSLLLFAAASCEDGGADATATATQGDASIDRGQPKPVAEAGSPAKISLEQTVVDFGTFPETESRSTTVSFTNTGGSILDIVDVKSTCGCTVAAPNKQRYQPGESGSIEVAFNPTSGGEQEKFVRIVTNDPDQPVAEIAVRANVGEFLILNPESVRMGTLQQGEAHHGSFLVSSTDPDFIIERVWGSTNNVTAELDPDYSEPPANPGHSTQRRVNFTLLPNAGWGTVFAGVKVQIRGRPKPDETPVVYTSTARVTASLFNKIHVDVAAFRFGVEPNEEFERKIVLSHVDNEPFEVTSATIANAANIRDAVVEINPLVDGTVEVILSGRGAPATPAAHRGEVHVTTNVPGDEKLVIPVIGRTFDRSTL